MVRPIGELNFDEIFTKIESKTPISPSSSKKRWVKKYAIFSFNPDMFGWIHVYWQSENNYYYPEEGYWEVDKGFGFLTEFSYDDIKSDIDSAKGYYGEVDKSDFWYKCVLVPFYTRVPLDSSFI